VPGGTGYLHELLANPKHLMEMLAMSRDHMAACACQHVAEQDGCYSCLYAYRNSYGMEHTSRLTALKMLESVLDAGAPLEKVDHLGKMKTNHWVDSELEARFPDALEAFHQHSALGGIRVRTSKDVIAGKVGFRLEIGERDYSVEIHPQLGKKDGVLYPCEPDFLMRSDRHGDNFKPVAVFLDGYRYHKHIVQQDLLKRQGIFLSRRYYTWSLTWHDVNIAFAGNEVKIPNVLREQVDASPKAALREIAMKHGLADYEAMAEHPPILMLLKYLSQPSPEVWGKFAVLRALRWLDQRTMQDPGTLKAFNGRSAQWPVQFCDFWGDKGLLVGGAREFGASDASLRVDLAGTGNAVTNLASEDLVLAVEYDSPNPDGVEALGVWQRALQLLNLGQFLPAFFAVTKDGLESGSFTQLIWNLQTDSSVDTSKWDAVAKLVDEELHDWLSKAAEAGLPIPLVGYELPSSAGAVAGEAELAWIDHGAVLLMDYQKEENQAVFEQLGWLVFDVDTDMGMIKNKLGVA
jgi:DEAD/DEAH box helicase domain-containing protein